MSHNAHDHKKAYTAVFFCLLVLTAITVNVAYHDFGIWNIVIAMLIATIKASLVVLYFMHMKYDHRFNQVVFASSFVFLTIFVGLTAEDVYYRPDERPAVVEKVAEGGAMSAADIEKWRNPTPELLAKGKTVYAAQCAMCHGPAGQGDGPAAGALNPKPRNLTVAEGWKFGRTPSQIFQTFMKGSPGTAMPSFSGLPVEDRWALVHYLRTLAPNPPNDTPETMAALTGGAEAKATPHIPIAMAMQMMAEPERQGQGARGKGQGTNELYATNCASCHGAVGEGGVKVQSFGVNPYVTLTTKSFSAGTGAWKASEEAFIKLVSQGLPGFGKPGIAHFTPSEWHALYEHVKALAQ